MHRKNAVGGQPVHLELEAARPDFALGGYLAAEEQSLDMYTQPIAAYVGETIKLWLAVRLCRDLQPNALEQVWVDAQIRHATPPAQPRQAADLSGDNEQRRGWFLATPDERYAGAR